MWSSINNKMIVLHSRHIILVLDCTNRIWIYKSFLSITWQTCIVCSHKVVLFTPTMTFLAHSIGKETISWLNTRIIRLCCIQTAIWVVVCTVVTRKAFARVCHVITCYTITTCYITIIINFAWWSNIWNSVLN